MRFGLATLLSLSGDVDLAARLLAVEFDPISPGIATARPGEPVLAGMPVGEAVFVEAVRVARANVVSWKDEFVHGCAVGVMANLAPYLGDMRTSVAQRLVGLCVTVGKMLGRGGPAADELAVVYLGLLAVLNGCLEGEAGGGARSLGCRGSVLI